MDFTVLTIWGVFLVVLYLSVVQLRRDKRPAEDADRMAKLRRLRSTVAPLDEKYVERHGERIFVDKLVAKRLTAKKPTA